MSAISTAGLTSLILTQIVALHEGSRATARVIEEYQSREIAAVVRRAIRLTTPDDVELVVTAVGGAVANSYRYRAEADRVQIVADLHMGTIQVEATRGAAGRGPDQLIITGRAKKPGQSMGRGLGL